ncbi:MAG: hypothetical protein F6K58_11840 [Symploca sp. SIO2E9]|nr:hypothetical protein [Symploca sp. SIO2E9]
MGRWGDAETRRWGDGEMGRWGEGEKILMVIFPSTLDNLFLGVPLGKL